MITRTGRFFLSLYIQLNWDLIAKQSQKKQEWDGCLIR